LKVASERNTGRLSLRREFEISNSKATSSLMKKWALDFAYAYACSSTQKKSARRKPACRFAIEA
jgi:hypothetical protein